MKRMSSFFFYFLFFFIFFLAKSLNPSKTKGINLREVKSLQRLQHPNITKLKEVIRQKDDLYLILEHVPNTLLKFYQQFKEEGREIPEIVIK